MTGEMKCPRLYLCLAYSIPSPPMSMQHMHQHDQQWYDPLLYHHVIILVHRSWLHLSFTVAIVHRRQVLLKLPRHVVYCFKVSNLPFMLATGPSSQVLSWSSPPLITWLNVMSHVQWAPSSSYVWAFATSPSHFHLHGICCSHTCTCGLITCVSHINTISPPRLSLNYQNQQDKKTIIGSAQDKRTNARLTTSSAHLWKVLVWFW